MSASATTKGSKRAIRGAALRATAVAKAREWTDEERDERPARSKRLGLKPLNRRKGTGWTAAQLALLGTDHDEAIAKKIGRTPNAVTLQRTRRKIPAFLDRRRG